MLEDQCTGEGGIAAWRFALHALPLIGPGYAFGYAVASRSEPPFGFASRTQSYNQTAQISRVARLLLWTFGLFIYMADGVRFELTEGLHPRRFSRPVLSTAQPPIRSLSLMCPTVGRIVNR